MIDLPRVDSTDIRDGLPEHAPIGPSSMKRILNCYPSLSPEGAIHQESSDAAMLGTQAHEAGEQGLLYNKRAEDTLTVEEHGQDTIDAVNLYIDYVSAVMKRCKKSIIEGKFVYSPDLFGTADFTGVGTTVFHVIDYKNGMQEVDAVSNEQLLTYAALALIDAYMYSVADLNKVTTVRMAIVQPRSQGEPIKEWECPVETVVLFFNDLLKYLLRAEDAYSHGEHCFFCPRKITCPHLDELSGKLSSGDVTKLTGKTLGEMLSAAEVIESRIKTLRQYTYSQMNDQGQTVPGYKLVNKRATRSYDCEFDKISVPLYDRGYTDGDLYKRAPLTVAQLEKVVTKEDWQIVEPHVKKVSSGTTLAKDSDKRAAVLPKAKVKNAIDKVKIHNLRR